MRRADFSAPQKPGGSGPETGAAYGIPRSRVYLKEGPWLTLFDFLCERFPRLPPETLLQRLAAGDMVDDAGRAQRPDEPYRAGQWLWYYREVPDETPVPFEVPVLYRDARLLVVDKPHFMATAPSGPYLLHTALVRMRRELDLPDLSPIHRLDRDTAGVLMFCIDPAWRGRYQSLFQAREVHKEYEAVAAAQPPVVLPMTYRSRLEERPGSFLMREIPGEPNSETRIELLRSLAGSELAHLRLLPITGRKHQLRAHMRALGMPIVNDAFYHPDLENEPGDPPGQKRFEKPLQLLARAVEFRDPVEGRLQRFESRRVLQEVAAAV